MLILCSFGEILNKPIGNNSPNWDSNLGLLVFQKIEYLNLEHQLSRKLITMTALKVNKSRPLPFAGTLIIEKILFREVWSVRDMSPTALK